MRYQSFYPFVNQQRRAQNSPPYNAGAPQQNYPFMPQQPQNAPPFNYFNSFVPPGSAGNFTANKMSPGKGTGQSSIPTKPEMYMDTANRLISTAQQYAPIVQQFAPMFRNIPAMWKLYRGLQSMPDATAGAASVTAAARASSVAATTPRPSVPKVFQPPI